MNLAGQLATLEALGLIQPVVAGAQVDYRFRHALVHDAAYRTLLKHQRRELHQAVGDVLDGDYGPGAEDLAPVLAFHFHEAGDGDRASRYFAVAGAQAARKYAHREAIRYYDQALQSAAHPPAALFHDRGKVYELQGDFEAARLDFERSAEEARAAGDMVAEWQALLSLALLWAGRDYDRSGEYCRQALALAEKTGQPALVARSCNRLGNWHLNVEQPREAAHRHDQALSIFQALHDEAGIAETLDLLGMASILGGDVSRGARYYQEAIEINRRLGDRLALANVLGSQLLAANGGYQTMTMAPSPLARDDLSAQGEQAARMTHEIGWRDGEAFTNMILSIYGQGRGDYSLALRTGQAGLAIATEIGHRQWMAGLHYALGLAYFDFLALPEAIEHMASGLDLSREVRSQHWTRCHIGMLSVACISCGSLDRAAALLAGADDVRQLPVSIGERLVTYGWACLAQARGQWDEALELTQRVIAAASPSGAPVTVPLLFLLRGELQASRGRPDLAEADFRQAIAAASADGERPLVWRLRQALGRLLEQTARPAEAAREYEQARALVAELAAGLPEAF
jgi:tetratricopeptide (TPR) repeat protein